MTSFKNASTTASRRKSQISGSPFQEAEKVQLKLAVTPGNRRNVHFLTVSLAGWFLNCPTTLDDRKQIEQKFRTRWNVHHALGGLDGKHISMKKPKKSGSEYYNYKGFLSLVLLALVKADYRFFYVDVGSSGSSPDVQIFNCSKLNKKMEDGILCLPAPEPWEEGGPD